MRSLKESWKRKMADRRSQGLEDRRQGERRQEQLPFEGPERRRGKDRRQYARRVMSGEIPLPDEESRGPN